MAGGALMDLSVIIPLCNEMPQVAFTVQGMIEELEGFCEYEIILVDNMSHHHVDITAGERTYPAFSRNYFYKQDTGRIMSTWFYRKGKIKYFQYDEKQGHWNAKNFGISKSKGKYLFFLDAHCIMKRDSVRKMLEFSRYYEGANMVSPCYPNSQGGFGAVHAYINYMLDSRSLEYKVQRKTFGYQFCTHQMVPYQDDKGIRRLKFPDQPYQVCVMSTCGMMCPRSVIDELGAWNPEFGIYGGGESYINWKQSTCGYGHWIHPEAWCWHFADKRGYQWNHDDYVRNSFIAAYVVGGEDYLEEQVAERSKKGRPETSRMLADDVMTKCKADREFVKARQVVTFDEYINWWEAHPGVWK
jgi:glycosyltransferase involved in cell wall biosynthesis